MKVESKSPPPNCGVQQQQQQDANPHGGNKRSKTQNNGLHQQQEGECNKMLSPEAGGAYLTVEKYILQLHQKDERIRTLEEENRRLRTALITKTNEFQQRVDELVTEERHTELEVRLEAELANCRKGSAALKESSAVKKSRRVVVPTHSTPHTVASAQKKAQSQQLPTNADEICAKLQSFVERNNSQQQTSQTNQQPSDSNAAQNDEEMMVTEQLVQLMAEQPSLLQAFLLSANAATVEEMPEAIDSSEVNGEENKMEATSLLTLLLDSADSRVAHGNESEQPTGQESQQNDVDFEEVMQRVIGEAMSGVESHDANRNVAVQSVQNNGGRNGRIKFSSSAAVKNAKQKNSIPSDNMPLALPKGQLLANKKGAETARSTVTPSLGSPIQMAPHHHSTSATAKPFTPEELELVTELEARIDQNVLDLGTQPLNTAELAIQCTRLMREYSIGQRLFARTVMCKVSQSQGSLSELLSKPRPWHKLTDKGRDAFRRIFGWISDDAAIELLCQLSPRKVTSTERIVHPNPDTLLEPLDGPEAAAMLECSLLGTGTKKGLKQMNSSASSEHSLKSCKTEKSACLATEQSKQQPNFGSSKEHLTSSSLASSSGQTANANSSCGRWRHDDIPREKIIDIYEAEKAKLAEQEGNLGKTMGLRAASSNGDSRVGSLSPSRGGTATANIKLRSSKCLDELMGRSSSTSSAMGGNDQQGDFVPILFSQSQQQPRGSLANASGSSINTRLEPFPIAQSQIERYTVLDTEEVVAQVKDFLAKNAVSQRQFGDSVLGLSQGSVSDLLARPKPWRTLTPKGREPFVRMHIFLEQYRAQMPAQAESKGPIRMEEEEEDSSGELDLKLELPDSSGPASVAPEERDVPEEEDGEERSEMDELAAIERQQNNDADSEKLLQNILAHIKTRQCTQPTVEGKLTTTEKKIPPKSIKIEANANRNLSGSKANHSPSPLAAATAPILDEIDTAQVARRVKECLSKSGISQRAFGEHILKMTSGCVSDLLTKPKPWVMLGWKQRQSYQKMLDFLNDPGAVDQLRTDEQHRCEMNSALNALKAIAGATSANGIEKIAAPSGLAGLAALVEQHSPPAQPNHSGSSTLQIVTNLANELGANTPIGAILKKANSPKPNVVASGQHSATKRKASSSTALSGVTTSSTVPLSFVTSAFDGNNESGALNLGGPPMKKIPRFQRTLITEKQKEALLFVFAHDQRPNSRCIEQLAAKLGLTSRTVTNWFHNYRTRQKAKEIKPEFDETSIPAMLSTSTATLTPTQILARALNAPDAKTVNWFRELAELLRRHSDANIDVDSIGGTARSSVGTASAESSPPSPSQTNHISLLGGIFGAREDGNEGETGSNARHYDGEREQSCEASSSTSPSSPQNMQQHNNAAGSQLDKVIARMHSRLAATRRPNSKQ